MAQSLASGRHKHEAGEALDEAPGREPDAASVVPLELASHHMLPSRTQAFEAPKMEAAPSGRAAIVAAVLTFVWLAVAAAGSIILLGYDDAGRLTLADWGAVAAGVSAPIAAIWLAALVWGRLLSGTDPRTMLTAWTEAETTFHRSARTMREELAAIEAVAQVTTDRMDNIRHALGTQLTELFSATAELEDRTRNATDKLEAQGRAFEASANRINEIGRGISATVDTAAERTDGIIESLPGAINLITNSRDALETSGHAAKTYAAMLREEVRQIDEEMGRLSIAMPTLRTDVEEVIRMVEERLQHLGETADHLRATAETAVDGSADKALQLQASVDAALGRVSAAFENSREGVHALVDALGAAVERMRAELSAGGSDLDRETEATLARLSRTGTDIKGALAATVGELDGTADRLQQRAEDVRRAFSDAAGSGAEELRALASEMDGLEERGRAISLPLAGADAMLQTVSGRLDELARASAEAEDVVRTRLAQSLVEIEARSAGTLSSIGTMQRKAADLASGLGGELEATVQMEARLADTVHRLGDALGRIRQEFAQSRALLGDIGTDGDELAARLAEQVTEAIGRIRDISSEATASAEASMVRLVEQARASLSELQPDAFGAELVEAARRRAEELRREADALNERASAFQSLLGAKQEQLTAAVTNDLTKLSSVLIENLNSASIDIAKMMLADVPDADWQAYLKGDKSIFARRAVRLVDRRNKAAIAELFGNDADFRDAVTRYVGDFEKLMARVMADPDGSALGVTLVSSDLGKLYVVLAQAIDRLR